MRVRPLIACAPALILEHRDVFEARIFLEISNSRGPNVEYTLNLFVAELRHALIVMRRLDDDFVRPERTHLVVHAFGQPARLIFDPIQWVGVRNDAHLPSTFARHTQDRGFLIDAGAIKRTRRTRLVKIFGLAQHYPTLRDWIAADFHEWWSAEAVAHNGARIVSAANPRGSL